MAFRFVFLTLAFLLTACLARPAHADCASTGADTVQCTDVDQDGFIAPMSPINLAIAPNAVVRNTDNGGLYGQCSDLALPAISLGDNSSVTNTGGVVVASGVCGWSVALGDGGRVTNHGQFATIGTLGFGILAGNGLTVTNSGTITTAGQTAFGIFAGDGAVITTAAGSLLATTGESAAAIMIGDNAVVTNAGTVSTAGGVSDGIDTGVNASIVNSGTISVTGTHSAAIRTAGGTASVTNTGLVSALFTTPTNAPGAVAAVEASGDTVTVFNSGTITGTYAAVHLVPTVTATLTNNGALSAIGEFRADGSPTPGGAVIVVDSAGQPSITIVNTGQIIASGGLPALRVNAGNVELVNNGAITGDLIFGPGDGTLAPGAGSSFTGTFDGGGGANTLALNGGGVFSGTTVNVALLSKSGPGTWTLHNTDAITGQASIFEGALRLASDARLTVPTVYVSGNGVLAGNGTIAGAVANSALVAPGYVDPAATLTITGAYTQNKSATLALNVYGNGSNDRLAVGGPVTLAGTLQLTFDPTLAASHFTGARVYPVITPLGQQLVVQGQFSAITTNATFFDASLTTSTAGVQLDVSRLSYGTPATTISQRDVGEMLDRVALAPPAAIAPLVSALDTGSMADAGKVLAALTPEGVPALQSLGLFTLDTLRSEIPMTSALTSEPYHVWGQFFDRAGRASKSDTAGFQYDSLGGIAGLDVKLGDGTRAGLVVAKTSGDVDFSTVSTHGDFNAGFVGATLAHDWSPVVVTAGITYGAAHPDLQRTRTLLGVTGTLSSRAAANLWSSYVTAAAPLDFGSVRITPSATLAYDRISLGTFDEHLPLAADVGPSSARDVLIEPVVRAEYLAGRVHPYVALFATGALLNGRRQANAVLDGVDGSGFVVSGAQPAGFSAAMEGGLAVDLAPGLTLRAGARLTANDVFSGRTADAGLAYRW